MAVLILRLLTNPIIDLFLDVGKGSFKIMMSVQPVEECLVRNNLNLTFGQLFSNTVWSIVF